MNSKKRVLLTGASGFVGGNFLNLYQGDFDITTVSLRDRPPNTVSMVNIDCVVHCAALVHQMKGAPEKEYFTINYDLTKTLALNAKKSGVHQFIFLSTAHVFGDSGSLTDHSVHLNEKSKCHPKDAYSKSKLEAENFLLSLEDALFKVAIIRPPMIYGKGAKGNIITLARLIKRIPILPLGFKQNLRSVVFVGNLCHFIALTIKNHGRGVLLPQDQNPVSLNELAQGISDALGKKRIIFSPPKLFMTLLFKCFPGLSTRLFGTLAFDNTISRQLIDYTPHFTTAEGLRQMFSTSD